MRWPEFFAVWVGAALTVSCLGGSLLASIVIGGIAAAKIVLRD